MSDLRKMKAGVDDPNAWTKYDAKMNKQLETAYGKGFKQCTMTFKDKQYIVKHLCSIWWFMERKPICLQCHCEKKLSATLCMLLTPWRRPSDCFRSLSVDAQLLFWVKVTVSSSFFSPSFSDMIENPGNPELFFFPKIKSHGDPFVKKNQWGVGRVAICIRQKTSIPKV